MTEALSPARAQPDVLIRYANAEVPFAAALQRLMIDRFRSWWAASIVVAAMAALLHAAGVGIWILWLGLGQLALVIFAAVGGRMSLVGAVYGALLVNAGKTLFSESFPDLWLFLMAALFIGVTMAFPMGLAGVWEDKVKPWWRSRRAAHKAYDEQLLARRRAEAAAVVETTPPAANTQGAHA